MFDIILNSDLKSHILVKKFYSVDGEYSIGLATTITYTTPAGYDAAGHLGIETAGFIGAAYAFVRNDATDVWLVSGGGTGKFEISILFVAK